MLKRIGAEEGGEFKAVASGTLPSGKPVVVNADGTVSVVSSTAVSQALGSAEVFESASTDSSNVAYDSYNQRIVVAYKDKGNSNQGTAIVGTVNANNTVTYGTAVVFETGQTDYINVMFDSSNNKIVIIFRDVGDSNKAKGIVGTVDPSNNSISFGSASSGFAASTVDELSAAYTTGGKVVAAYKDTHNSNYGNSNVGTVSGTSITFGSSTYFELGAVDKTSVGYDTANDKVLIFYIDTSNSGYPTAIVGTVSGTSISYGTAVVVQSNEASISVAQAYDTDQQKFGLFYKAQSEGKAAVATISGTSVTASLKTPLAAFEANAPRYISAVYHQASKKIVVAYEDDGDSFKGKIALPQISGTNMLDPDGTMPSSGGQGSPVVFDTSSLTEKLDVVYDSVNKKAVIAYSDGGNSEHGTSVVFTPSYNDDNLTSENYIGMSRGVAFQTGDAASVGSAAVFESASTGKTAATFDSSNNKIVISYRDNGNSSHGTAVVGTVSGSSISFGTPVVFNAAATNDEAHITFDSNSNKVVVVYSTGGQGVAKVGTVSGTSISFGSATVFDAAQGSNMGVTFDSTNNKVVVVYTGTNNYVESRVGTISGTSISFGTAVVAKSSSTDGNAITFDSNRNKIVIVSRISTNAQAMVGTVSGTDISFASSVGIGTQTKFLALTFDSSNNKVITAFVDGSVTDQGKVIVGDIDGSGVISFGTAVEYNAKIDEQQGVAFDSNANKVIVAYDSVGTSKGQVISGTVSGTSITFDSETVFEAANVEGVSVAFDSNANKSVISYIDAGNSNYGTSVVFTPTTIATTRAEVANSGNASIDIIGSVSDNQIGLTAGQQYFVQNDGTISTTADSPSVLAGTAISATELVVKT